MSFNGKKSKTAIHFLLIPLFYWRSLITDLTFLISTYGMITKRGDFPRRFSQANPFITVSLPLVEEDNDKNGKRRCRKTAERERAIRMSRDCLTVTDTKPATIVPTFYDSAGVQTNFRLAPESGDSCPVEAVCLYNFEFAIWFAFRHRSVCHRLGGK